jgi:hypothetical protein
MSNPSVRDEVDRPRQASYVEAVVRPVAAACVAGALVGVLVGGLGGRLAMALLAGLNREDHGLLTDDGFTVGQFTVGGTVALLGAAAQLGLVGGLGYLVLRRLALGPRWLRLLSLCAGVAVVFEALLLEPDGVDFTALDPAWVPILLFLALPAVFVLLLALLCERWLAPGSWFARGPLRAVAATLLVSVLGGPPLVVLVAVAVGIGLAWRGASVAAPRWAGAVAAWVGRALCAVLGFWALATLVENAAAVV